MSAWSRLRAAVAGLFRRKPAPPPPAREPLHWRPIPRWSRVACGAEGFLPWTGDVAHSTCEACKDHGALVALTRKVRYR